MSVPAHVASRQRKLCGLLVALILLVLAAWFVWPAHIVQRVDLWLHGEQPIQFYLTLDGDLLDDYSRVFGVAHNSGVRLATTREALDHGAEVIEIDVVLVGDTLHAAHDVPPWFVTEGVYRGPRLDSVWFAATEASVIALDLKESTPRYIDLMIAFLKRYPEREVIVTTPHRPTLEALRERAPHAYRFFSAGTQPQLDALYGDMAFVRLLDGVSVHEALVTDESAGWLHEHGLMTLAWTVNDIGRLNELVKLGVSGITTDNLAIVELLGGQSRDEALLGRAVSRRMN